MNIYYIYIYHTTHLHSLVVLLVTWAQPYSEASGAAADNSQR
jgi:hypothetical protein